MQSLCAVRFMGHASTDLEPLLHLLQALPPCGETGWHARYILLLWLSLVCLLPFRFSVLDSSADQVSHTVVLGTAGKPLTTAFPAIDGSPL